MEWNASDYARQSSVQEAMAEEQRALLDLEGWEQILDVGCGDGKITAKIVERVPPGFDDGGRSVAGHDRLRLRPLRPLRSTAFLMK
jgi:ubiquinone/menaquinone biosynthesis C-methylase UbiE